jgi:glucokinase
MFVIGAGTGLGNCYMVSQDVKPQLIKEAEPKFLIPEYE